MFNFLRSLTIIAFCLLSIDDLIHASELVKIPAKKGCMTIRTLEDSLNDDECLRYRELAKFRRRLRKQQ